MKLLAGLLLCSALWAADPLVITVLYDNTAAAPGCEKDWGFAAFVTMGTRRLMFDTGANAEVFARNLDAMKIDARSFDRVLISHRHADHTGGIAVLQQRNPRMQVLWPDPPDAYEILLGFYSTGTLAGPPPEQALVIETAKGLVVVTGCSHAGVVNMVEAALKTRRATTVRFLVGGFHMLQYTPAQISDTIAKLKKLNVQRVAATHCTGDRAIAMFRDAFGANFEPAGAGKVIVLE